MPNAGLTPRLADATARAIRASATRWALFLEVLIGCFTCLKHALQQPDRLVALRRKR